MGRRVPFSAESLRRMMNTSAYRHSEAFALLSPRRLRLLELSRCKVLRYMDWGRTKLATRMVASIPGAGRRSTVLTWSTVQLPAAVMPFLVVSTCRIRQSLTSLHTAGFFLITPSLSIVRRKDSSVNGARRPEWRYDKACLGYDRRRLTRGSPSGYVAMRSLEGEPRLSRILILATSHPDPDL